jgi:hypothetical protein
MRFIFRYLCVAALIAFATQAYATDPVPPAASAAPVESKAPVDGIVPQTDPKLDLAIRLVRASGGYDAMTSSIADSVDSSIAEQKKAHPEVSDAFWAEFKDEFNAYVSAHKEDLLRLVAHVYVVHLTEDELKEAVAFYETGPGKKMNDPAIPAEAAKAGEAWGAQAGSIVGDQVLKKLQASAKG